MVSQTLKELDEEYYLLEDVNLLSVKENIDHVLVGPNGIFAIEVKNYSGKVSCHKDMWYQTKRSGMHKTEIRSISIQVKKERC